MNKKLFNGFKFFIENNKIIINDFGGYELRNQSTIKLIIEAAKKYNIKSTSLIYVNTGDQSFNDTFENHQVISYSTNINRFDLCCPDFVFDHWKQTGLIDFENERIRFINLQKKPLTSSIGWRGPNTHYSRQQLINIWGNKNFTDFELIEWNRTNPEKLTASNFLSFEDQFYKWRFLIDLEGVGYSGRLKLLLSLNRVVFIQDRAYKEFYFEFLKPWVHFVPIKNDLSDLEKNYHIIMNDKNLENFILNESKEFSNVYLSKDAVLKKWRDILYFYS